MARSLDSDSEALDLDPDLELFPNFSAAVDLNFGHPPSGASPEFSGDGENEGLRVTGLDSDSDYEEGVAGLGIMNLVDSDYEDDVPGFRIVNSVDSDYDDGVSGFGIMNFVDSDYEDGVSGFGVMNLIDWSSEYMVPADGFDSDSDLGLRWDGFGCRDPNDEEWEEVDETADAEREELGALGVIEELSEISAEEEEDGDEDHDPTLEAIRSLEWEILLAGINSERDSIFEPDADFDSYLAVHGDDQGETLFGQFEEMDSALQGSPPAAKAVVESLPLVELRKEGLGESIVVCAVCKDDVLPDEKVRKLPCCHYYHSDCILPWLSIRNTCPICRYELATDDAEYERRKAQRDVHVHGLVREAQVRFNFALFA